VEEELAEHQEKRDGIYKKYKAQKERYDAILSQPLKKMKRLDMFINTRKKVLLEVSKEIELATKKEETATDPAP
jgi:23S rRNA A1618 N6-methylase RlmF